MKFTPFAGQSSDRVRGTRNCPRYLPRHCRAPRRRRARRERHSRPAGDADCLPQGARRERDVAQQRASGGGGSRFLDDAAVEERDSARGEPRIRRIVRHHDQRRAALVQLGEQLHHRLPVLRVQVSGGLVREQDEGIAGDGAGDGHALLLAARELPGHVARPVAHADAIESVLYALLAIRRRHSPVGQGQLDVLEDGQVADQVEALEDEPDVAVADVGAIGGRQVLHRLGVEQVLTACGGVEQAEDGQERGLARPGGTHDREPLVLPHRKMDVRESVRLHLVGEEDLLDVLHFDQRIAHRSLTRSVESHWDMSERITASPSARPSTTSTVLTELRPSRTFTRCASSPPLISLNSSVWPPGCAPAGRPTKRTFCSFSISMVPSTVRSGRAPRGSSAGRDTSTSTDPWFAEGEIRETSPLTTPFRVSTTAERWSARSRACVSGMRSTALSRSGCTTLARSAPGVTHCPSSSGSSERTPRSMERTFIESTCLRRKATTAFSRSICAICAATCSLPLPATTPSRLRSISRRLVSSCARSICCRASTSLITPSAASF